ncbi:MAG: tetratricopeptide repeat protein [cyanobacterium endosymbiont of Rhopalodia gibba]|jgi:tetratricopeptide (TPR) repeat protein
MLHFSQKINKVFFLITVLITVKNPNIWIHSLPVLAQVQQLEPDPLATLIDDPLLPSVPRPLTPFEQRKLREKLNTLNAEAQTQLHADNDNAAFEIWYRELRLRRVLGRLEEIKSLGRVGEIAWNRTRTEDVQVINKRLVTLQELSEKEDSLSPALLMALADAYKKLHALDNSLAIYQKVFNNARKNNDSIAEEVAIRELGQLYLAKFDYPKAAPIYEDLLNRAQTRQNILEEGAYLQILAEIYGRSLQPENAARIKQKLVKNYLSSQELELIPSLKTAIGKDYEILGKPEIASQNYQEAYSLAWSFQLFGAAAEALTQLGKLYQKYDQNDYALQIYKNLIQVEQLSYNYYGLMRVYERIGQIYMVSQQYELALDFFKKGLILAKSLNYKQNDFLAYIRKVNTRMEGKEIKKEVSP